MNTINVIVIAENDKVLKIIKEALDGNLIVPTGEVLPNLTDREKEILCLITKGKSNTEISKELYLSAFTVKNYVSKILEKLEVKDRTEATAKAIKYGLI